MRQVIEAANRLSLFDRETGMEQSIGLGSHAKFSTCGRFLAFLDCRGLCLFDRANGSRDRLIYINNPSEAARLACWQFHPTWSIDGRLLSCTLQEWTPSGLSDTQINSIVACMAPEERELELRRLRYKPTNHLVVVDLDRGEFQTRQNVCPNLAIGPPALEERAV